MFEDLFNFNWLHEANRGNVNNSTWTYKSVNQDKRVRFVNEQGEKTLEVPTWGQVSPDFNAMKDKAKEKHKDYKLVVEGDAKAGLTEVIEVPDAWRDELAVDVTMNKKKPMMCLYDATKEYCESILGVKFTSEDRTFFEDHPATQEDGVPMPDTLRVVQELIAPYGLRVSRVQAQPNYRVNGDLLQWQRVLGCNPLGMADRTTSNNEFLEKMNLTGKENPDQYRFEYTKQALFPAIACGVMYGGEAAGTTGSTGGHATYIPPRRRVSGALLSFQIERADRVKWRKEPVFPEHSAEQAKTVLCFDLDKWWNKFRYKGEKSSGSIIHTGVTPTAGFHGTTKPPCYMCARHNGIRFHSYDYPGVCDDCFDLFIKPLSCSTKVCAENQTYTYPELRLISFHAKSRTVYLQCGRGCHKTYAVAYEKAGKTGQRFIRALEDYMKQRRLTHYSIAEKPKELPSATEPKEPAAPTDVIQQWE